MREVGIDHRGGCLCFGSAGSYNYRIGRSDISRYRDNQLGGSLLGRTVTGAIGECYPGEGMVSWVTEILLLRTGLSCGLIGGSDTP